MRNKSGHLQAFFDLAEIILLSLDKKGRIDYINPNGARILGWEPGQLLGQDWFEMCLPADCRRSVRQVFNKVICGDSAQGEYYQNAVLTREGKERVIAWHNRARRNSQGVIIGSYSTGTDITRSIVAERGEQASEARYRAVVDTALDAIITCDARGMITTFNRAAERHFGYRGEEVIGRNVALLMSEPYRSRHDDYINNYLDTGIKKIIGIGREVVARRKDGSKFPIELAVTEDRAGSECFFTGVIRDISERKKTEGELLSRDNALQQLREQLLHMDRLHIVNEMASGIAHEINQPLTAIINYATACQGVFNTPDADVDIVRDIVNRIGQQAQRAAEIVRMLRNMMKRRNANFELVDLVQLIEGAVELCQFNFDSHGISIDVEWPEAPIPVEVDPIQIQQVLLNLINNSVDSLESTDRGEKFIAIVFLLKRDKVRLAVRDNGVGVPAAHRDQLFEPFFTNKADGLGLGLSICRSVIMTHGGELRYNPDYRPGSEFYFELPLALQATTFSGTRNREKIC